MKITAPLTLVFAISLFSCGDLKQQQAIVDPIPQHDSLSINSNQVNERRVINIWTPPAYANGQDSFPVLYMADGGVKEDFSHIANTLAELIAAKKIEPTILVGIENTQRRRDLSPPTTVATDKEIAPVVGESAKFRNFMQLELVPEIDKLYRTQKKKGIIGESLSGLFVMETFFLYPDMFDYYIAFDPSLWWNNHELVTQAPQYLAQLPQEPKQLWFAGSDAEDIYLYTRELAKTLESTKPPHLKWTYSDEPKEQHGTIFRATKEKALIWTLGTASK